MFAWRWSCLTIALVVDAFDTRCVSAAGGPLCDTENPCRSDDCWNNIFTHSYCCIETPCFWWGSWSTTSVPYRSELAESGAVCRYLCQAEPGCSWWSFIITQDGGPCLLYNSSDLPTSTESPSQVVSGFRFCPPDPTPSWPRAPRCDLTVEELPIYGAEDDTGAARAIHQHGWAVLKGALAAPQLEILKLKAPRAAEELLRQDPQRVGNRGPRRYSWGGSSTSHHMVHWPAWAQLLDVAPVVKTLEEVFQGEYLAVGGGGDFVLGETDSHQRLHVDLQLEAMYDSEAPAAIVANFVISEISCNDGPLRLVPHTQNLPMASQLAKDWGYATHLQKEDSILVEKNLSYVFACPLSPGDVILRDMRLWHGGSPNLGLEPRYLPSAEFLSLRYAEATRRVPEDHFTPRPALPFASWLRLSPATQRRSREILSLQMLEVSVRPEFLLMLPYVAEERP